VPLVEERFEVEATPETVWSFLLDPKRLAPCIPGCDAIEIVDERTYRVRLTVKVGFLSTRQDVVVRIVESEPPRRLVSEGRGEDTRLGSQVDMRTTLDLSPAGDRSTAVTYTSDVKVLGRLGSVGDAVMKVKAKQLATDFARRVKTALEQTPAGSSHSAPSSPPSGERVG
jgi:carbon monoxide dehydrogenase subunit G